MTNQAFSLVAVGDLVATRPLFPGGRPGSEGFAETVELIRRADIAFGNLENPLTNKGFPREKLINFRADPSIAAGLKRVGFDVLSLANNHSLDYSYEGLYDTMEALDGQGIRYLGAGRTLADAVTPLILDMEGVRVGFIAFSCLLPTGAAASAERPGLAPIHIHTAYEVNALLEVEEPGIPPRVRTWARPEDQEFAEERVRSLREDVDFLAVSLHWGYGSGEDLAEYQRPLGHAVLDAGADVILGHHVHAIHGIEVYDGKAIFYSPGNFIAQQPREGGSEEALEIHSEMSPDQYAAWLEIEGTRDYAVRVVPTSTNPDGLPEVAHGELFRRMADRIQRLSAALDTHVEVRGEEIIVPM